MKIARISDRFKVKMGEATFIIGPLTKEQKAEVVDCEVLESGNLKSDLYQKQCMIIKYGLKDLQGVQTFDETPYILEMENGSLTEACVSDLLMLEGIEDFAAILWQTLNSIPDQLTDGEGKVMEGVKLEYVKKPVESAKEA